MFVLKQLEKTNNSELHCVSLQKKDEQYQDLEDNVFPEKIIELPNWHIYKNVLTRQDINVREFKDFLKKIGMRFICGSAAIFLYNLENFGKYNFTEQNESKFFHPGDIDCMAFSGDKWMVSGTRCSFSENYWTRKTVKNFAFCENNLDSIISAVFSFDGNFLLDVFRNTPSRGYNDKFSRVAEMAIMNKCAIKVQISEKKVNGKTPEEKTAEYVKNFDISVAKLIYDVEKDSFELTEPSVLEDIKGMKARYFNQPFNYYLDRFGTRRLTSHALKRILKYMDRGYEFTNLGMDRNGILLALKVNERLENINNFMTRAPTDIETASKLLIETYKKKALDAHRIFTGGLQTFSYDTPLWSRNMDMVTNKYYGIFGEISAALQKKTKFFTTNEYRIDPGDDKKLFYFSGSSVLSLKDQTIVPGDIDVYLDLHIFEYLMDFSVYYLIDKKEIADLTGVTSHEEKIKRIEDAYIEYQNTGTDNDVNPEFYKKIDELRKKFSLEERLVRFFNDLAKSLDGSLISEIKLESYTEEKSIIVAILIGKKKVQFIVQTNRMGSMENFTHVNRNFDMSFCRAIVHCDSRGKLQYRSTPSIETSIRNKRSDYLPKRHNFTELGNDLVLNEKSIERVNKYIQRGYELYFMGKKLNNGSEVIIKNGVGENLNYFFQNF